MPAMKKKVSSKVKTKQATSKAKVKSKPKTTAKTATRTKSKVSAAKKTSARVVAKKKTTTKVNTPTISRAKKSRSVKRPVTASLLRKGKVSGTKTSTKKAKPSAKVKPVTKQSSKAKKVTKLSTSKKTPKITITKKATGNKMTLTPTMISKVRKNTAKLAKKPVTSEFEQPSKSAILEFAPYHPKPNEEYMSDAQLMHFAAILQARKQALMEEVDRTMRHMKDDAANFPDPNDRASQEEEFSFELRARDRERKLIKKIEETLERIKIKDYGYCDACGADIGIRRLEARPTATLCIDCKTLDEIKERQTAG